MTTFQKIIKYGAIAFAIYLVVMIISGIVLALTAIFGVTTGISIWENNNQNYQEQYNQTFSKEYSNVENLEIDLAVCKLEVKKGETLKVETSNVSSDFKCEVKGNTLKIQDKRMNISWFGQMNVTPTVIVTIPENQEFDKVTMKMGVNETSVEALKADLIEMEMGVGRNTVHNVISDTLKIKGGAGDSRIDQSTIGTLKVEAGVGRLGVGAKITQSAKISSGVGRMDLDLQGEKESYQVNTKTGLGNLVVDNQSVKNDTTVGNGNVLIKVEAGVGETIVNFIK